MGFEVGRRDDLDHLEVLRMLELAVADARRLVEAAPRLHHHAPDAFVLEEHPALQHVDELHGAIVVVPLAMRRLARPRANDVRHHSTLARALDAEVAVLEVAAQAAARELSILAVRDLEARHGACILGYASSPMLEQSVGTK